MAAAPLTVYDGTRALGEIEDDARKGVRAFSGTGKDRKLLGTYPTRREAMRAVSAEARRQLTGPASDRRG